MPRFERWRKFMRKTRRLVITALCLALPTGASAVPESYRWRGDDGDFWNNDANWQELNTSGGAAGNQQPGAHNETYISRSNHSLIGDVGPVTLDSVANTAQIYIGGWPSAFDSVGHG